MEVYQVLIDLKESKVFLYRCDLRKKKELFVLENWTRLFRVAKQKGTVIPRTVGEASKRIPIFA